MRFDQLASKAGRTAADVGRQAERPPFAHLLGAHHRRILIAGWSTAAAAAVVILGVISLWSGPGSVVSPAALATTTTIAGESVPGVIEGGREACPVTEPGDSPFTPASETPNGPLPVYEAVWYGTPDLWTMVHHQGQVWANLPVRADGSLTQKTFWWSDDYIFGELSLPNISVTAEHLNGSASTVEAGGPGTNGSHRELGEFMLVGLRIPEEGCWRITAEYRGTTLTYVAWVSSD